MKTFKSGHLLKYSLIVRTAITGLNEEHIRQPKIHFK